ncbi:hypothetical protein, partial [Holdemanella biformis]|uniref:hypothetical protein n=1 Tax=Holdemanella biformis TaxID=1735 RepID=UPI002666A0CA
RKTVDNHSLQTGRETEINNQSGLLYYSLYRDFLPVLEGEYHIVIISCRPLADCIMADFGQNEITQESSS